MVGSKGNAVGRNYEVFSFDKTVFCVDVIEIYCKRCFRISVISVFVVEIVEFYVFSADFKGF